MQFGIFGSAQAKRGGPSDDSAVGFREFVDRNISAEKLGYKSSFVVEHHFTGFGQISATLNLLTWIAARTSTLRLGTAVLVLPWHNPVLLAEQIATLDLLSGGRVDIGIGKGYRLNEFDGFAMPIEESDERFQECLDVMLKSWTSDEAWSHDGKYWKFNDIVVEPPTHQRPHPQLWMGAGSDRSVKQVASLGYNMLLGQFDSVEQIAKSIDLYKTEVESHGRIYDPKNVAVARSLYILDSEEEYEKALESRMAGRRRTQELTQRPGFEDTKEAALLGTMYGSVDTVKHNIKELSDIGAEYILLNSPNGLTSLETFASVIMPEFSNNLTVASP
ncbi:MAG: LLM class flavin-dependent oxidoreductase [Dehalococcoidia bacterium]|nr:LLM class flavin-dependent oxidoreductase [Dehalococcoidia bacterium]